MFLVFFYLGFLSRPFTNHRSAGKGGGCFFNSSLPLPTALITEDQAVAEVFNKFFVNVFPNLKISTDHGYNDSIATDDEVTNAVNKFRNDPGIIMIKNKKKK